MGGGLGVLSGPRLEESFTSKRFRGSFCDTFGSGTLPRRRKRSSWEITARVPASCPYAYREAFLSLFAANFSNEIFQLLMTLDLLRVNNFAQLGRSRHPFKTARSETESKKERHPL